MATTVFSEQARGLKTTATNATAVIAATGTTATSEQRRGLKTTATICYCCSSSYWVLLLLVKKVEG